MDGNTKAVISDMVDDWLTYRYEWDGAPLANLVSRVAVVIDGGPEIDVWGNPSAVLPRNGCSFAADDGSVNFSVLCEAFFENGKMRLTGLLIHPDTGLLSPEQFEGFNAQIKLGCLDRHDPDAPYKFNPQMGSSIENGVLQADHVAQSAAYELAADFGWGTNRIMAATTAATIAGFAAHEAMEFHQSSCGVPVLDPHEVDKAECVVEFADGTVIPFLI